MLTITLAGGTRAMVKRNVIVRKLDSLEALGAVTDICSDKTGTLTQGKMVCKAAWIPARGTILVGESNEPFNPTSGELSFTDKSPVETKAADDRAARRDGADQPIKDDDGTTPKAPTGAVSSGSDIVSTHGAPVETLLNIASLCNVAKVYEGDEGWTARGDPTECAIQVLAHRFQWGRESLTEGDNKRWSECDGVQMSRSVLTLSRYRPAQGVPLRLGSQAHVRHRQQRRQGELYPHEGSR